MNRCGRELTRGWATVCVLTALLAAGCVSRPRIDWNARVGSYTFDQAVIDMGPPDKSARLSDGSVVAEWVVLRGGYTTYSFAYGEGAPGLPYGTYSGWAYGPYGVTRYPDRHLRLVFDPGGRLKSWKQFDR